jgi:HD-like signal output (HDOD) protein/prolyl-tRNA editing enzyme YbaK/EbsC (Cys-tRNA(Pro) deacylase)
MADRITRYIKTTGLSFEIIEHTPTTSLQQSARICGFNADQVAQAFLLNSPRGVLMAVLPLSHIIDLAQIKTFTALELAISPPDETDLFEDCEPGATPPLAIPYKIQAILDTALLNSESIYMIPGNFHQMIKVSGESFERLHHYSLIGNISIPIAKLTPRLSPTELLKIGTMDNTSLINPSPSNDETLKHEIIQTTELPAMPDMALRLLPLHSDPNADFMTLANIVETDPSLTAQVLHYANSAFFPHHAPITSLADAIRHSIGFDMTLNLVIAISVGRSMRIPSHGPLGLNSFWYNAVFTANISKEIAKKITAKHDINPNIAYLAGLLHNIGFLLWGHLRPEAFASLNQLISHNPDIDEITLERKQQSITHTALGGMLLSEWGVNKELSISARYHHEDHYQGEFAIYPTILRLIDYIAPPLR